MATAAQKGLTNGFPAGQCTYYADDRYHQLTGYYVPWIGDAWQWAGQAPRYGWVESSIPIVPSIIVLQPSIQGADAAYGHVGVVEKINSNGSVVTSDLNWGRTAQQRVAVSNVTFKTGSGVSFVYAQENGVPLASSGYATLDSSTSAGTPLVASAGQKVTQAIAPNADVTMLLYILDQVLALKNPFDMTGISLPSVNFFPGGPSITDPVAWTGQAARNLVDDFAASVIRTVFLALGFLIVYKVLAHFIDFGAIGQSVTSGAETLAKGAVLLA